MGERKGVNKYYPPDYDPKKGGLNKFLGTHALRERARKLHMGILIIRFEMPYNIWCEGCKSHIGMGVRYNAEKKKVGMYYTTPVYQFRMKCHLCPNHFEIKTDPQNLDYVIVSGAQRQEKRFDPAENGQVVPDERAVGVKLASDAMYKLEHGAVDEGKAKALKPTMAKLQDLQGRVKDDYLANRQLRQIFRDKKKCLALKARNDANFLNKHNLNIHLQPESVDDEKMAALLRLQPAYDFEETKERKRKEILSRPLFGESSKTTTPQQLSSRQSKLFLVGVKVKSKGKERDNRCIVSALSTDIEDTTEEQKKATTSTLVSASYDSSDSD